MRNSFLFSIAALLLVLLYSCTPQKTEENTLLWKISGNGLTKNSYLFGTWNFKGEDSTQIAQFYNAYPKFTSCFDSVSHFMTGSSPEDEINHITGAYKFIKAVYMPVDTTYRDIFSEASIQWIDSITTQHMQLPIDAIQVKPLFLMYIIYSILDDNEKKVNNINLDEKEISMDSQLFYLAKEKKYRVRGLEHRSEVWNDLLPIFHQPLTTQASRIEFLISPKGMLARAQVDSVKNKITDAYLKYDINATVPLFNSIAEMNIVTQQTRDILVRDRNKIWVKNMILNMKENPIFFAISIQNLPGEDGVINLLRKKGYTVEAVK